tara:strand:- start:256 stop:741 length:486 start_codon:yes stop_codon:yes gene_type:complete
MFSDPQFWVAISFFLFIAAIFNPVRKMLTSNLDSQIKEIKSKIDDAENLRVEAQNTLNELKLKEANVEKEIEILKNNTDAKIKELKDLSLKKLSEQIEKKQILANNKIDQLLRDTNNTIKLHIANISIEATTNLLKQSLTKEKKSELIDKSIKDLNSVLKN